MTSLIEEPFDLVISVSTYPFSNATFRNATLYVPEGTEEKYEATEGWKNFERIVVIGVPQDVIEVKNADGVTIYYRWNSLTELSVSYRGDNYDSYANEYSGNVVIPSSVTYDGKDYSVTSIGNQAFASCYDLTSVEIPNSVTSIGTEAFLFCGRLTSVTSLIEEPFDIEIFTFNWDATLYVPAGTKEKYEATEGWKNFKKIVEINETGIDAVDAQPASSADAPVYNLNGQRVNAPVNGIYIKSGRKVLVK